jgi:hypothetical protein
MTAGTVRRKSDPTVGGSASRRRIDPREAKVASPAERAAEPDDARAGNPSLTQSRRSPMEPRTDEQKKSPEPRHEEPKTSRFRIVKLEERIAPISFDGRMVNTQRATACR